MFNVCNINISGTADVHGHLYFLNSIVYFSGLIITCNFSTLYSGTARAILEFEHCMIDVRYVTFKTNQNTHALIGGAMEGSVISTEFSTFDTTSTGAVNYGIGSTKNDAIAIGNIANKTTNVGVMITPWLSAATEAAAKTNSQNNPGTFYWYPEA